MTVLIARSLYDDIGDSGAATRLGRAHAGEVQARLHEADAAARGVDIGPLLASGDRAEAVGVGNGDRRHAVPMGVKPSDRIHGRHRGVRHDHRGELMRSLALSIGRIYNALMSTTTTVRVSSRGQMSLPAAARHRWGVEGGGEIGVIDLDGALLLVPGGIDAAKKALRAAIANGRYERAVRAIDDADLSN